MRILDQWYKSWVVLVLFLFTVVPCAGVHGAAEEEQGDILGLIDMKECVGVTVTQCEVAKNLINTLQMGEDLTCGACFIHLKALGIAPGEDWSYEDPHKVITQEEMNELIVETHLAYNNGLVRHDGFEAAARINRFCQDMKGPSATPAPSEQGAEQADKETSMTPPSQDTADRAPALPEEAEHEETPPAGIQGSDKQKETSD
jgi:hypothetical protein